MQENNDGDNIRSASGQDDITCDDGDDQNTAQQGASIADSATALRSNGAPAAPNKEQEAAILDSDKFHDDAQNVTNIAQSAAATTIVSQDVREALSMDSELSHQQQPEAKPVGDENIINYDHKCGDVTISEKNATTTMISSVIPPDQMVTDSSSSISATTTSETQPAEKEAVYVNHGLAVWEMNRQRWLQARPSISTTKNEETDDSGHGRSPTTTHPEQPRQQQRHAKQINVDEIIDAIFTSHKAMLSTSATNAMNGDTGTALSSSSNMTAPFPQSVPLPQMIDILQDLWEAESL